MRININALRYSKWLAVTLIIRYNLYKTFFVFEFLNLAITLKKQVIFEPFAAFPAGQTNFKTVTSRREISSAGLFDFDVGELSPVRTSDIYGLRSLGHRFIYISYIRKRVGLL